MRKYLLILLAVLAVAPSFAQSNRKGTQKKEPTVGLFSRRQPATYYVDQITNLFSQHRWAKGK